MTSTPIGLKCEQFVIGRGSGTHIALHPRNAGFVGSSILRQVIIERSCGTPSQAQAGTRHAQARCFSAKEGKLDWHIDS
jgi:hypothetical protein